MGSVRGRARFVGLLNVLGIGMLGVCAEAQGPAHGAHEPVRREVGLPPESLSEISFTVTIQDYQANRLDDVVLLLDLDGDAVYESPMVSISVRGSEPAEPDPDVNGDGAVTVEDIVAVILGWGACPPDPGDCPADLNGDNVVDVSDLVIVILGFG